MVEAEPDTPRAGHIRGAARVALLAGVLSTAWGVVNLGCLASLAGTPNGAADPNARLTAHAIYIVGSITLAFGAMSLAPATADQRRSGAWVAVVGWTVAGSSGGWSFAWFARAGDGFSTSASHPAILALLVTPWLLPLAAGAYLAIILAIHYRALR